MPNHRREVLWDLTAEASAAETVAASRHGLQVLAAAAAAAQGRWAELCAGVLANVTAQRPTEPMAAVALRSMGSGEAPVVVQGLRMSCALRLGGLGWVVAG